MDTAPNEAACFRPGRTWEKRKAGRGESRREQQFYRYYGPFRQMSDHGPQYCDVREPEARKKHKAVSCPDKILTAFCQLGALRLKARRCLIFFFDVNHAYIMAEATQSLSLENDAIHDLGDEVWLGHSVIPRDVACCEITVNLPTFPISAAPDADIRKSAFVVNDLTKHQDLCNRPYVTGYPNGRFYAGVPITTPDGVNIGAYCILDDKVRDGLPDKDLNFLRDMSQTVMTHLETVRASADREHTTRMVAGLGDFVRGSSDAARKAPSTTNATLPVNGAGVGHQRARTVEYRLPDALIEPYKTPVASSQAMTEDSTTQHKSTSADSPVTDGKNRTSRPLPPPRSSADDPGATYQRAAETLCQSLDIDGVVFLDAFVPVFGGLSDAQNADSNEDNTTADSEDSAGGLSHSESLGEPQVLREKTCRVLGCAQTLRNGSAEASRPTGQPQQKFSESFLRRLLRRNPHGRIWTFDEDLTTHSEDGLSSEESGAEVKIASGLAPGTQQRKPARKSRRSVGEILQAAFPGSRCIALHGIWDYSRKRWAVAGFYWTLDPLRHIAKETEMQFVAAFCDIIVAETKRLEVIQTDQAKSDFISTVSHELRSPLHGILGSCELLLDHGLDNAAMTLLEQVDSCGRTLLEIIEHLLDFANLRSQRLKKNIVKSPRHGPKFLPTIGHPSGDDSKITDASVALDDLTEDAVVSSVYSFYYGKNVEKHAHPPVILDIDRSEDKSWHCNLATGGWKRVCINLVTNALKYTPSGFIRVSLKQEAQPRYNRRLNAVLTVSDTGKGMSKEFQHNRLFHDFSQEDTVSDGLGLGMHMVSRIVHTMGGKIEVLSDQEGTGTSVTVHVPLEHTKDDQPRLDARGNSSVTTTPEIFEGLQAGLVMRMHGSATLEGPATAAVAAMAMNSIENCLKYLGIRPKRCEWQSVSSYDLMIIMEAEMAGCLAAFRNTSSSEEDGKGKTGNPPPVLVICNNSSSAQGLQNLWATDELRSHVIMEHIALPCGIKQITRGILSALRLHQKRTESTSSRSDVLDKIGDGSSAESTPLHDGDAHKQFQIRPVPPPTGTTTIQAADQARQGSNWSHPNDADVFSMSSSFAKTLPSHISSRRRSAAPAHVDVQSAWTEPPSRSTPATPTIPATTKLPILLLVDDNNINLSILATFAKKHGYPHVTARDGQLAVNAFENAHASLRSQISSGGDENALVQIGIPNVILMDINMPIMDGYEAVQRIRAYEKQHRIAPSKIIAVTAVQSEAAQAEAFGSGFDMFLSKPLKLKDLAKLIEACMQ
ncbi:hypothetical protein DE146DRAFT_751494 [Phaeosphaeria sp. MPI-PUGE-AT-0046c]|nr:hypothetical protein DE146DRAFT_751494 [Phaeosphaeria sp. MPI-PUGE-AT-0046c]